MMDERESVAGDARRAGLTASGTDRGTGRAPKAAQFMGARGWGTATDEAPPRQYWSAEITSPPFRVKRDR